jgi:hypothetical protein
MTACDTEPAAAVKDPDAVLDYGWDWSDWLTDSETISASEWIVDAGLTEQSNTHDDTTATVWLVGGAVGATYGATNRITTTAGRTDDRTISIFIQER